MFKELNGVTTRGLVNEEQTGMDLLRDIKDTWYNYNKVKDSIDTSLIYENDYKEVDEELQKLIGVHEITGFDCYWKEDFINKVESALRGFKWAIGFNDMKEEIKEYGIERLMERYKVDRQVALENIGLVKDYAYDKMSAEIKTIISNLKKANYDDGTVLVGKRNIKIFKYIKSEYKKILSEKKWIEFEQNFEKSDFVTFYNMNKECKKKLYLVITNSMSSILGMSSYAAGRNWQSCQNFRQYHDDYAISCFANLTDKGSLIAYVTDGNAISFDDLENYEHHNMMCRTIIRILKKPNSKDVIAVDRLYPNTQYADTIFKQVFKLVQETNCLFGIYCNYNTTSDNHNYWNARDTFVLSNADKKMYKNKYRIKFIESSCTADCSGCDNHCMRACNGCPKSSCRGCDRNENHCDNCRHYDVENCAGMDCQSCNYNPCIAQGKKRTHYDDQNRANTDDSEGCYNYGDEYIYEYDVYAGEENLNYTKLKGEC